MWEKIDLWHLTYNSHSCNLLLRSLTDHYFDKNMSLVVQNFKTANLKAEFKNLNGSKIVLLGDTH